MRDSAAHLQRQGVGAGGGGIDRGGFLPVRGSKEGVGVPLR